MGLIFGIGFPPFHGGALKYADRLGLKALCERAQEFAHFGPLYQPTKRMLEMAANNERYYG
jgi:3-hydroxyacyl-CoA dehydrogenase/enoyl-CoA hydratase/3-hydroxybutyryl-CoA epimerase/enoyl-CoA isomerase